MARSSSQKFIARTRAPRVNIEYDVEVYGATRRIHIPFVIGVFADLAGQQDKLPPNLEARQMKEIDIDNFDVRLREQRPRIALSVPDSVRGEGELDVDLTFEGIEDFLPGSIARKIPGLNKLLEERTQLMNLASYMDGKTEAEALVERILNSEELQDNIAATPALPSAPADQRAGSVDDSFRTLLQKEFSPKTPQALAQLAGSVRTMVEYAVARRGSAHDDPVQSISAMVINIDHQLEQQITLILHHPDFQRLESAWRGLHYLVSNSETSESLKIRCMSLSKSELEKVIGRYRGTAWDQNPLFKKIYEEVFGQLGGEPYGCLVGDYEFAHGSKDLMVLAGMAEIAAAAHAPFLAAGSPALIRAGTWSQMATPCDISRVFAAPEYAQWRALRESEASRYLALTVPRMLARLPYGAKTCPVEEFNFDETVGGQDASCPVWANSAYALAANIGRAFNLYGWCARIHGIESGGVVEGLPSHQFSREAGGSDRSPMEISITDRMEAEFGANGLTVLLHRKNTDSAAFISAQSLHKADQYDDPDVTAGAALAARLPYLLASCRFVHYLKCIARDAVGSFASREDMEQRLNNWILQYVDRDPANSGQDGKARKPLADAQIVLEPIEGNSASYAGKIYIRPQYQLEGLTVSLRLESKFP
jgi:type VI secretion system protein ImpC